jgi:hypothetical protein
MRLLITWFTVDLTKAVLIVSPFRAFAEVRDGLLIVADVGHSLMNRWRVSSPVTVALSW